MNYFFYFCFLLILFISILCENDFDENEPYKIKIKYKKFHSLKISFDFTNIEYQTSKNNLSNKYLNNVKNALLKNADYFKQLFKISNNKILNTEKNISKLCQINISKYDNIIKNGIKTDLLIYPLFNLNQTDLIKGGICALEIMSLRPIIGYISISTKYNFNNINSEDTFSLLLMHEITHILGFSKIIFKKITENEKGDLTIHKFYNKYYINGNKLRQTLESLYYSFNYYGIKLELRDNNNYYPHWEKDLIYNDYMKSNFDSDSTITHFTISLLQDLGWYSFKYKSCNLYSYQNDEYCVLFKNKCIEKYNHNIHYYIQNGVLRCFLNMKYLKKSFCIPEENIQKEYKRKILDKKKINICNNTYQNYEREEIYNKFPEFKKIKFQNLKMLIPSKKCKNPQKTIFFEYLPIVNETHKDIKTINIRLTNPAYFVCEYQDFGILKKCPGVIKDNMQNSNIIHVLSKYSKPNLLWYNIESNDKNLSYNFHKFQKFNHLIADGEITVKSFLYRNYLNFKKNFSEDFNYMSETYILPYQSKKIKNKFLNYTPTKDNLWLIKPSSSSLGRGIHFLKQSSDIPNNKTIISKYISNPDLIKGRKYDIRIYCLVTGINPLKIYVYKEGIVRIAVEKYDLNINDLDNLYKHLTNVAINKKNKKFIENDINDNENSNIWSLSMLKEHMIRKGVNFNELFIKIQDICIKSILTMYSKEIKREKKYTIINGNLFELFGMDILLDKNMKPWLLEVNYSPSLSTVGNLEKRIKYKLFADIFNILGFIPYNHITLKSYEKEYNNFNNSIIQNVEDSICEFMRPLGGFIRAFPRKENIDYYKKFINVNISENEILWEKIKKINI
jgi:hypothetical protein